MPRVTNPEMEQWSKFNQLEVWKNLPDNLDPYPVMKALDAKSEGSTFGACGVRIDGTPEFIDAVLSRLKTLLQGEYDGTRRNRYTRLNFSRRPVAPVEINGARKEFVNSETNGQVCYIRLVERSRPLNDIELEGDNE